MSLHQILIVVPTMCVVLAISVPFINRIPTTYKALGEVVSVSGEVVAVDIDGESWEFYGDGYSVGDVLTVTMGTNGVASILDDSIIDR